MSCKLFECFELNIFELSVFVYLCICVYYNVIFASMIWGCGAAAVASALHAEGQGFNPLLLHHIFLVLLLFLVLREKWLRAG